MYMLYSYSPKLQITHVKPIVVHPYSGILLTNKKDWTVNAYSSLGGS